MAARSIPIWALTTDAVSRQTAWNVAVASTYDATDGTASMAPRRRSSSTRWLSSRTPVVISTRSSAWRLLNAPIAATASASSESARSAARSAVNSGLARRAAPKVPAAASASASAARVAAERSA